MMPRGCSLLALLLLGSGCTSPTVSLATRKPPDAGAAADAGDAGDDEDSDHENEDEDADEECESPFRECEDAP
jgi:hypothetical protein